MRESDFAVNIVINETTITVDFEPQNNNIEETKEAAQLYYKKMIKEFSSVALSIESIDCE